MKHQFLLVERQLRKEQIIFYQKHPSVFRQTRIYTKQLVWKNKTYLVHHTLFNRQTRVKVLLKVPKRLARSPLEKLFLFFFEFAVTLSVEVGLTTDTCYMTTREFNTAVDLHADSIYRFVLKHVRNRMLADDVVQETYAKVWERHEQIQAEKAKSYLFTSAYHCMLDLLKKENRSASIEGVEPLGNTESHHNFDIQRVLHEALDTLPEIQKSVVLLRDYEGYSYEEIAEITGLTDAQVKVYIFRARQALKSVLKSVELVA